MIKDRTLPYDGSKLDTPPAHCVAPDCDRPIMARGMCAMHYARFTKYGTFNHKTASPDYKARYARWSNLRKRYPDMVWKTFKEYEESVGLAPGYNFALTKNDKSLPIGPDNFVWRKWHNPSKRERIWNTDTPQGRKAYDQHLLAQNPDRNRDQAMRRNHGIDIARYNEMLVAQSACCAICRRPETLVKGGRLMNLAIDHDHSTDFVRGLLCSNCNRALGMFEDNPEFLANAISYLRLSDEKQREYRDRRNNVIPMKNKGK